jgi:hypothetical protein
MDVTPRIASSEIAVPAARDSEFIFVNIAGGEVGRAMTDGRAREVERDACDGPPATPDS